MPMLIQDAVTEDTVTTVISHREAESPEKNESGLVQK